MDHVVYCKQGQSQEPSKHTHNMHIVVCTHRNIVLHVHIYCMCTYNVHTHTHTHTHTQTHIHTHTHTQDMMVLRMGVMEVGCTPLNSLPSASSWILFSACSGERVLCWSCRSSKNCTRNSHVHFPFSSLLPQQLMCTSIVHPAI